MTRIHRRSASNLGTKPASAGDPFTLAFLDPPYERDLAAPALAMLISGGWIAKDAIAIVEQSAREAPVSADGYRELDRRKYGGTQIGLYKVE